MLSISQFNKIGNKNQKYFIFGKNEFFVKWQAIKELIQMNSH